jgi:hypothetical protein
MWFTCRKPLAEMPCESREARCMGFVCREPLAEMRCESREALCMGFACREPLAATLSSNLGMLHVFVGTPCEDEERICEESRGHRALHGVLFLVLTTPRQSRERAVPSRGRRSKYVASSSERKTTRHAYVEMLREYVGMPREPLETPTEERSMPTVKAGGPPKLRLRRRPFLTLPPPCSRRIASRRDLRGGGPGGWSSMREAGGGWSSMRGARARAGWSF